MKKLRAKARVEAFTLIELLVVIAILVVLAAMLAQTGNGDRIKATLINCTMNQKQIALGFIIWEDDNGGRFPWQDSTTNGGTMELIADGQVTSQFQVLSNHYVMPTSVFVCPTDKAKHAATDYGTMSNQNISYFVNVDASTNTANTILTGDRHLQSNGNPAKPGLFAFTNGMVMSWTRELHGDSASAPIGVMAFADGHAQVIRSRDSALTDVFRKQNLITARLLVP